MKQFMSFLNTAAATTEEMPQNINVHSPSTSAANQTDNAIEFININGKLYRTQPLLTGSTCDLFLATPLRKDMPNLTIKMLRSSYVQANSVLRQFLTETKAIASFSHPNLPHFHAKGYWNKRPYLAYEHIEGTPLMECAQHSSINTDDISIFCTYIKQVLDQLSHLHAYPNPISHGDISTENIIISPSQSASLIDFGCAHFIQKSQQHSYRWLAKPSYLSPEQARGEPWDTQSDLYQVGIIFYELLKKQRWITGKSPREKLLCAATINSPRKNFLTPLVPLPLSDWIAQLLQKHPSSRPSSAKVALEALIDIQKYCFIDCSEPSIAQHSF